MSRVILMPEEIGLADYLLMVLIEGVVAGCAAYLVHKFFSGDKMMARDREEGREGLFESYGEADPGLLEGRLINVEEELMDQREMLAEILELLKARKR